jgi:AraC family transcriptional regulator of adaptative response / DNA-3-methyladenine glycosylase II
VSEDDLRYSAVQARDPRFDGWFFVAVTSTGIYCRPSCASVLPGRARVRFYPTAAAAQRAGFRACKRCRPDASPGSPEWNHRGDVVGRAMRDIADGVVDREGVLGLAGRLGYSTRQLNRLLLAEVGAGPLDLARAQRAQTARILLDTTDLPIAQVAFAAGFGSVRQFNDTVRAVFSETPTALRARAGRSVRTSAAGSSSGSCPVTLRLAYRAPFPVGRLFAFLSERAVLGVEEGDSSYYRRALALPHGGGIVTVRGPEPTERYLHATMVLDDLRDLTTAVKRVRQLFDLDADPAAVVDILGTDPLLGSAVRALPGLRLPGHVDGDELAVRAVLGQQVSVAGAGNLASRLAALYGELLSRGEGSVVRRFPGAAALAALSPADLPMPGNRARALIRLTGALASGEIDLRPGADRDRASASLLAIPGIGAWTVAYIRMRALGDPDAFPAGDLGIRRALRRWGQPTGERDVATLGERWRPYRAYAVQYLWSGAAGRSDDMTTNRGERRPENPTRVPPGHRRQGPTYEKESVA